MTSHPCPVCGHLPHPGGACGWRGEFPGETYECPCRGQTEALWCREKESGRCGSLAMPGQQTCFFHLPPGAKNVLMTSWRTQRVTDEMLSRESPRSFYEEAQRKYWESYIAQEHAAMTAKLGRDLADLFWGAQGTPPCDDPLLEAVERVIEAHSPTERPDTCLCGWRWEMTDDSTCLDQHIAREVLKVLPRRGVLEDRR